MRAVIKAILGGAALAALSVPFWIAVLFDHGEVRRVWLWLTGG